MSDNDLIRRGDALALPYRLSPSLDASDGYYVSVDAILAIPAAQADYDASIRSALTVTPHDHAKVQALVDALEFYADRDNYEPVYERMPCDCCTDIYEPVKRDEGDTARAAIAAWKEGE